MALGISLYFSRNVCGIAILMAALWMLRLINNSNTEITAALCLSWLAILSMLAGTFLLVIQQGLIFVFRDRIEHSANIQGEQEKKKETLSSMQIAVSRE